MAAAPNKKTGSSPKFIDNDSNANFGKTPSSGKKGSETGNSVKSGAGNLAKLPKGSASKGKNFINRLENKYLIQDKLYLIDKLRKLYVLELYIEFLTIIIMI